MAIPKSEYREENNIQFVTNELIEKHHKQKEVEAFGLWFGGQTGMITSDGSLGIYVNDYERWIKQGKLTEQLSSDWD